MARIKVTGYIDTDNLDPEQVDLDHPMGLSNEGFEAALGADGSPALSLSGLDDVEFNLEDE